MWEIIRQICDAYAIQILQGRVSQNPIHVSVSSPPKLSVSAMVRLLKVRSSRRIQEECPQLGTQDRGTHFWGMGSAAFRSGHVSDKMIQEYLEHHDQHLNPNDDTFVVAYVGDLSHLLLAEASPLQSTSVEGAASSRHQTWLQLAAFRRRQSKRRLSAAGALHGLSVQSGCMVRPC